MIAGTVGADVEVLTATARQFGRSSDALRRCQAQLGQFYAWTAWTGQDAEQSRGDWRDVGAPTLLRTSEFLAELEAKLLEHAAEQRSASGTSRASSSVRHPFGGPAGDAVDAARELVADALDRVLDGLFRTEPEGPSPTPVTGLRPDSFVAPDDGRAAVVAAMRGLADEQRIDRDEIEVRALDNGRFIVVLPGVTDLSAGLDQFVDRVRADPFTTGVAGASAVAAWVDNDEPTVRKMRYAYEAARRDDTSVNEYSVAAAAALEAAGVPPGAEVMIIGHSFGAYTAMDLAADATFNSAFATPVGDVDGTDNSGYRVRVTHVIAAGAETDWRFREIPAGTNTLVVNNRVDLVYRVEDLLHGDGHAIHPGHLEQHFWGGWQGKGHDEHNYIEWLADTGNDRVESWLSDVGERYAAGGIRFSARVPDPNL